MIGWSLLLLLLAVPTWANSYTTSFSATESPMSEGGHWVQGGTTGSAWTNVNTAAGTARGSQTGFESPSTNDSIAVLTGTWGADQTAQATVHTTNQQAGTVLEEVELLLRFVITANVARGYEINWSINKGYTQVVRWAGAFNTYCYLDSRSLTTLHENDVVKATITGTSPGTITVYLNGSPLFAVATNVNGCGSTYTDGTPGIGFYFQADGSDTPLNGDFGFTDYTVDDGLGPPPSTAGAGRFRVRY